MSRGRFPGDVRKLNFMRAGSRRDARRRPIVELATRLVRSCRPDAWGCMAREIHLFCQNAIRYQHDPDLVERLEPAELTLELGVGDCDAKARLAVALARALGIEAKVWPIWKGPTLAHVVAGYRWPGSRSFPGARSDGWVIGDSTVKGAALGQSPLSVPLNRETGRLPLA